jgi:hypothetical protein
LLLCLFKTLCQVVTFRVTEGIPKLLSYELRNEIRHLRSYQSPSDWTKEALGYIE